MRRTAVLLAIAAGQYRSPRGARPRTTVAGRHPKPARIHTARHGEQTSILTPGVAPGGDGTGRRAMPHALAV